MNYCVEERGMNQPLTIRSDQVSTNPFVESTNINPTASSPGISFPTIEPTIEPTINITLEQLATLTVIYLPSPQPISPSNVNEFQVQFTFPNQTTSPWFTSIIPNRATGTTTTPSTGVLSETTPTAGIVGPSPSSPQVDLPANYRVPENTVVSIKITGTINNSNPEHVRIQIMRHQIQHKCNNLYSVCLRLL